jgi:hypothetical protein
MRAALAPLHGRRIPVAARFAGLSKAGYAILEDVETPGGNIPYTWVTWPGRLPFPGDKVRFEATVRQYFAKGRGEFDFGLKDLTEARP